MTDRFNDIQKQGFMKLGRQPKRKPKKPLKIVSCDKCRNWHWEGKHVKAT